MIVISRQKLVIVSTMNFYQAKNASCTLVPKQSIGAVAPLVLRNGSGLGFDGRDKPSEIVA
jgi:hypothetical protein